MNHELPDRIIMYRDGVGDGQLKYVYETELKKIQVFVHRINKISESKWLFVLQYVLIFY